MEGLSNRTRREETPFDQAIEASFEDLYRDCLRRTHNVADAEDLMQEVFERAYRFQDKFEIGTNMRAWLKRIAKNTFINHFRRKARARTAFEEGSFSADDVHGMSPQTPEDLLVRFGDEVTSVLEGLHPHWKNILLLVDSEDFSYQEAADALGIPLGTVMSALHRARRVFHERLKKYARDEGAFNDKKAA